MGLCVVGPGDAFQVLSGCAGGAISYSPAGTGKREVECMAAVEGFNRVCDAGSGCDAGVVGAECGGYIESFQLFCEEADGDRVVAGVAAMAGEVRGLQDARGIYIPVVEFAQSAG